MSSKGSSTDPSDNSSKIMSYAANGRSDGTIIHFEDSVPLKIDSVNTTFDWARSTVTEVEVKFTEAVEDTRTTFYSQVTKGAKAASDDILEQGRTVNDAAQTAIKIILKAASDFTAATEEASKAIIRAGDTLKDGAQTTSQTFFSKVQMAAKETTADMIRQTITTVNTGTIGVNLDVIFTPNSDLSKPLEEIEA